MLEPEPTSTVRILHLGSRDAERNGDTILRGGRACSNLVSVPSHNKS